MRLSTKSQYAMEGLLYIALKKEGATSVKELSELTGTTAAYLEQIFFKLKHAGLVFTVRGARGGFLLARPPDAITAGDVIRAVEGTLVPVKCVEDLSHCKSRSRDGCPTRAVWRKISAAMGRSADGITLAALRDGYRNAYDEDAGGGKA